jgi:hypothetical protein
MGQREYKIAVNKNYHAMESMDMFLLSLDGKKTSRHLIAKLISLV